jgi:hypothetical protein
MSKENVRDAWMKVSDELSALALKLKYHVEEEQSDDDDEIGNAFDHLASAIDDLADAAGSAARDPAVRDDVLTAGGLLVKAVSTTLDTVAGEVRSAVSRKD